MPQARCRILCIDDHEDTSEMLSLLLTQEDYDVVTAPTMQDALRLARDEKFDLYVFDKHLPDGDGLELCTKLNEITPGVPCLFYSGDAYDIHIAEAMAVGADGYVTKPDIDGLIDNVRQLLANRKCDVPAQTNT